MIELMNIINSVADSNVAYYALIGVLVVVVLSMIYLIYSQNKEMEELQKEKDELEYEMTSSESDDMVEEIATNVKAEKNKSKSIEIEEVSEDDIFKPAPTEEEMFEEAEVKPVDRRSEKVKSVSKDYEWLHEIEKPKEAKNLITETKDEDSSEKKEPVIIKEITNLDKPQINKVHTIEEVDLPREKKLELIDATLTNIPNLSLLDATMTNLPNVLEYDYEEEKPKTQEDLLSITRELELAPRDRIVKMTDYEKEQEKKAIISYDELLDHKDQILADIEEEEKTEPAVQEFQPEENAAISIDEALEAKEKVHIAPELEDSNDYNDEHEEIIEDIETSDDKSTGYEYEENFLAQLKNLQSKLN